MDKKKALLCLSMLEHEVLEIGDIEILWKAKDRRSVKIVIVAPIDVHISRTKRNYFKDQLPKGNTNDINRLHSPSGPKNKRP